MLIEILKTVMGALRSLFRSRAVLLTENLVLRQQVIVLQRSALKPRIRKRDRVLLVPAAAPAAQPWAEVGPRFCAAISIKPGRATF
jgi:hypothetical protein